MTKERSEGRFELYKMKARLESDGDSDPGEIQVRGRPSKRRSHHQVEKVEINTHLNKLQELVPCLPKNTKLSKLEVISNAIDYIRDLSQTLGLPSCNLDFAMETESTEANSDFGNSKTATNTDSPSSPVISQTPPVGHPKSSQHHRQTLGLL
ncbi:Protein extra-macrochaetae [Orchesella cincta]|uniref:Protein extra-macrochaetae n=1 Tax=Orchesella cincta TaxID=48709 RepID=A0A1D2MF83_ORCCI|nr:Protein extra-macrochaetae [Orchesella cincta]